MERIHVSVRPRPLSPEYAKTSPWRISGNSIFIPNSPSKFEFDHVFDEACKTEDVYRARTGDIVAASVRGFNGTVFAYGQTSSGKTHTMRGSNSELGVIPLAVHDIFDIIQQEIDREFSIRMSYMEIYNEEINDLLAPEHRKLQIYESIERGIFVDGLREEIVTSAEQVLQLMACGESRRHIGETNMNVYSSRSHTIFRMIIGSREKTEGAKANLPCDAVRVSFLNLVDLAGSERATKTKAEGVRLKEGTHINKSLMTLGTVINKLSEGIQSHRKHVPYRESKLTRILQPALGGNANTAIICNITLAQKHVDETKSSLQFASRALRIKNCACVNEAKGRDIWCSGNLAREKLKERTIWDIQIDYLERKLDEADIVVDEKCSECGAQNNSAISHPDKNSSLRESDVILVINQLHTNELHASHSELSTLKEEVSVLRTSLEESKFHGQKLETYIKTLSEEKKLLMEEHKKVKVIAFEMEAAIASLEDQLATKNEERHEAISRAEILASDLQTLCDELHSSHLELSMLKDEVSILRTSLEESKFHGHKLETSLKTLSEEKEELLMEEQEKLKVLAELSTLKEEVSVLRTSLEESKFHGQKLETSNKTLSEENELLMEEHTKLKVLAFEMEATIASLEDHVAMKNEEKHEAISRAEILASDLQTSCDELHASHAVLSTLKEEVSILRTSLEESKFLRQKLETSLKTLSEEKDELLMQLTEALLSLEVEKSIWSSKEKASMEVIEGKEKLHIAKLALLSKDLSEAKYELKICRKKCNDYEEWLTRLEEKANLGKQCSKEKLLEFHPSINEQKASDDLRKICPKILNPELNSKCQNVFEQVETLQLALSELREERSYLLRRVQKLVAGPPESTNDFQDQVNNSLREARAKLDVFRIRYQESVEELDYKNKK